MRLFGFDLETHDPLLKEKGVSWIYGQGKIIVGGLYDAMQKEKRSFDGNGGKAFRNLFCSSNNAFVGANIGYDLGWTAYEHKIEPWEIKAKLIDISIAESLIDEYQPYSLDALAVKYLRERKGAEKLAAICTELGLKGDFRGHLLHLWDYPDKGLREHYRELIREYVVSDADQPVRIWERQKAILEENGLMDAFWLQMSLVKITWAMKKRGVRIDYKKWLENSEIAAKIQEVLKKQFTENYGEVNLRSGKQKAALFDKHNIPYKHKIVFKGWQPDGRKFLGKTDQFKGDEVWDQRKRLKEFFPNVRVSKGKIVLMVPSHYAERTASQAINMGYAVSNNPSINKFTYEALKATEPMVADIVELLQVSNIVDKFLGPNFERFLVKSEDGEVRLHGTTDPVGARQTGRMSSRDPNLQNIPSKTVLFSLLKELPIEIRELCKDIFVPAKDGEDGKLIPGGINLATMCREVFIAEKGHMICKLDFNGQENRLQAHFATNYHLVNGRREWTGHGDTIRALYNENPRLDEHQFVADRSGLQDKYGKKNGRKYAKNVRFGLGYGMMLATMCEQFGWSKEFAQELTDAVKDASPWVGDTMEILQDALLNKRRYIKTLIGRHIHLQEGKDRDAYKFYNYLIQGSAADMLKLCIARMAEEGIIDSETACGFLLLLVHDEAVFSVPTTPAGVLMVLNLQMMMETTANLSVPVICDPEIGDSWADTQGQDVNKETGEFTETAKELIERMFAEAKAVKPEKTMARKMAMALDLDDDDDVDFTDFSEEEGDEDDDED
jgi:DNA polymerase I-like protein with 3'-5' exonuclease and polymerase domains